MNDFELESKLKDVRVPERPAEYWGNFPSRVRAQLPRERREFRAQSSSYPRFAWAAGFALAVALAIVCIRFDPLRSASAAITQQEKNFHMQVARLDAGLHTLVLNMHGMDNLLYEP
jgi:hypothetical protein